MRAKRIAVIVAAALLGLALEDAPSRAAAASDAARAQSDATRAYAQQAPRVRRPRTRIEIRPPRKIVRECTSWLQQEFRPSGTVIVPKMRCWWRPA
jgi:hypothetical protein